MEADFLSGECACVYTPRLPPSPPPLPLGGPPMLLLKPPAAADCCPPPGRCRLAIAMGDDMSRRLAAVLPNDGMSRRTVLGVGGGMVVGVVPRLIGLWEEESGSKCEA